MAIPWEYFFQIGMRLLLLEITNVMGENVLIFGQINTMTESDGSTFHDMTKVVGR